MSFFGLSFESFFQQKRNWIFLSLGIVILLFATNWLLITFGKKSIIGVQIVTNKGTLILAKSKYTQKPSLWKSPLYGYFRPNGQSEFYRISNKQSLEDKSPKWSIEKNWSTLSEEFGKRNFIDFHTADQSSAKKILDDNCYNNTDTTNKNCHWKEYDILNIESFNKDYICLEFNSKKSFGGSNQKEEIRLRTLDLNSHSIVKINKLFENADLKAEILSSLYKNLQLNLNDELIKGTNGLSIQEVESKIKQLLTPKNYQYNLNNVCLHLKSDGPYLVFGFPSRISKGNSNQLLKERVLLDQSQLPEEFTSQFKDYLYLKDRSGLWTKLKSPDKSWEISQNMDQLFVNYQQYTTTFEMPAISDNNNHILGIFWIYNAPTLDSLEKHSFKEVKNFMGREVNLEGLFNI